MTDQYDTQWPLEVTFEKGRLTKVFLSVEEAREWFTQDVQRWQSILQHSQYRHVLENNWRIGQATLIQEISSAEQLRQKFEPLQSSYLPYEAVAELIASTGDGNLASSAVAEILSPNTLQLNNPQAAAAKSLAILFVMYGNPRMLIDDMQKSCGEARTAKGNFTNLYDQFQKKVHESTTKCDDFITTFSQKIALAEPRKYWKERAEKHERLAHDTTIVWNISLIVVSVVGIALIMLGLLGIIDFSIPKKGEEQNYAVLLERLTLTATILGFAVWWLRQKLRDVRSHEHLAEDAAERVTMIDTYTSLRSAGLQGEDMAPILNALYRPATTGLIDDGGPVLPMEILLKTVAGAAK